LQVIDLYSGYERWWVCLEFRGKLVSWKQSQKRERGAGALPFLFAALCVGLFSAQALKVEKTGTGMAVPMAGGEEDGRSTGGEDGSCAWKPDPKKGQEAKIQFRNMARISLKTYVGEVLDCLMANMRAEHLPSLKMLVEMAALLEGEEVSPEAFESFAKLLKRVFDEERKIDGEVVSVVPLN
jgi:hypothetical protein